MRVICQLCGYSYAEASLETLRYPLSGAMFASPDPVHGYPMPFDPSLEWQFMMCPMGRVHRPMIKDDEILTEKGTFRLPKDGNAPFMIETPAEIDRTSISDRVVQVSDEEAERQAREILQGGPKIVASDEVPEGKVLVVDFTKLALDPFAPTGDFPEEVTGSEIKSPIEFTCPLCAKAFPTERAMKGHLGGAHRSAKKKGKK